LVGGLEKCLVERGEPQRKALKRLGRKTDSQFPENQNAHRKEYENKIQEELGTG